MVSYYKLFNLYKDRQYHNVNESYKLYKVKRYIEDYIEDLHNII